MTIQPHELFLLVVLAAWAAADTTAFGQFMVGQPMPAGLAAGWLLGEPAAGFALGALLQLLWSRLAPVGAAAYPDVGPATVGGAAFLVAWLRARGAAWPGASEAFLPLRGEAPTALLLGLIVALITGWAGQKLVAAQRRGNARFGGIADRAAAHGDFGGVERANLAGLARAAGAGALLVLPGLLLAVAASLAAGAGTGGAVTGFGSTQAPVNAPLTGPPTTAGPGAGNPGPTLFLWTALAAAATTFWPSNRRDLLWLAGGIGLGGLLLVGLR